MSGQNGECRLGRNPAHVAANLKSVRKESEFTEFVALCDDVCEMVARYVSQRRWAFLNQFDAYGSRECRYTLYTLPLWETNLTKANVRTWHEDETVIFSDLYDDSDDLKQIYGKTIERVLGSAGPLAQTSIVQTVVDVSVGCYFFGENGEYYFADSGDGRRGLFFGREGRKTEWIKGVRDVRWGKILSVVGNRMRAHDSTTGALITELPHLDENMDMSLLVDSNTVMHYEKWWIKCNKIAIEMMDLRSGKITASYWVDGGIIRRNGSGIVLTHYDTFPGPSELGVRFVLSSYDARIGFVEEFRIDDMEGITRAYRSKGRLYWG